MNLPPPSPPPVDSLMRKSWLRTLPCVSKAPLLTQLKRPGARLARARTDVDDVIVQAADEGHSRRVLARAAGVSHERVHQLLRREDDERT